MAVSGVAPAGEAADLMAEHRRLNEKRAELNRLQDLLAKANAEKEAAQRGCAVGIVAARAQMGRLRSELATVRKANEDVLLAGDIVEPDTQEQESHNIAPDDYLDYCQATASTLASGDQDAHAAIAEFMEAQVNVNIDEPAQSSFGPFDVKTDVGTDDERWHRVSVDIAINRREDMYQVTFATHHAPLQHALDEPDALTDEAEQDVDEDSLQAPQHAVDPSVQHQQLQLEVRTLRHELSKWRHQAEWLEKSTPQEEDQIVRMKAELTHTIDILESTRHAAMHHEVERDIQKRATATGGYSQAHGGGNAGVPLFNGGHGGVEAQAERGIRERMEQKNQHMSGKAKQLMSIACSQQLLVQRLEKALVKEEGNLGKKDARLSFESDKHQKLKESLRRCSNDAVAAALGVPGARKRMAAVAATVPQEVVAQLPEDLYSPPARPQSKASNAAHTYSEQ